MKTVCPQGHVGSNPTLSVKRKGFAYARLFFYIRKAHICPLGRMQIVKKGRRMLQKVKAILFEYPGIVKKKFRIGIMMLILVILLAGALFLYYHNPNRGLMLACPVRFFTGFYCPGCGAGRACYALLHGEWYQAFRYNPMLIIILPWLMLYYIACGIQWLIYGKERISNHIPERIPVLILILFLLYGIVRNIHMYPFVLLAPTRI